MSQAQMSMASGDDESLWRDRPGETALSEAGCIWCGATLPPDPDSLFCSTLCEAASRLDDD